MTHFIAHAARNADVGSGDLVAIAVPMGFFSTVVVIVGIALLYRYRRDAGRIEAARNLAENGKEIPAGLLAPAQRAVPASDLKRGFILVATGLGLSVAALFVGAREALGIGFIPGFIGLAYLAVWRIQRGSPRETGEG